MRALVLLFLALFTAACGTASTCGPELCASGCCDERGVCQTGTELQACGTGGATCGSCGAGLVCTSGACVPACQPVTCAGVGLDCGTAEDGCGGRIMCGSCGAGMTCGAGGLANRCGVGTCTPRTCSSASAECGSLSDGCADVLDCGGCAQGEACGASGAGANHCGCAPKTCQQLGKNCGSVDDGCGGTVSCGGCASNETCGGGGVPNVCAPGTCVPTTCAAAGKNCGQLSDGCGQTLSCGTCSGFETCGGAGTTNVCGAVCAVTCPSGFSCSGGVCTGGSVSGLVLDVKSHAVSGRVTVNGVNPVSTQANCSAGSGGTYLPRGSITFTDPANGYSFMFELQGCTSTNATFSGTVFPGTYKVTVRGNYSNLPGDDFVVATALAISADAGALVFDVRTHTVSGAVTLNGANPMSTQANCSAGSGGTYLPRGSVSFYDATNGYSFTFELQGCMSSAATFSGTVFPGTYRVTVQGDYSNLPGDDFVVNTALAVSSNQAGLALNVQAFSVSGAVTLNGANPVSSQANCSAGAGGTYLPRGSVTFTDAANGYSFMFELQGCMSSAATFSGTVFPGTYRVTVQGNYSNLPGDSFVVATAQVISGNVASLAYDVKSFTVAGRVTLNGANPVSTQANCSAGSGGTYLPRGTVSFYDAANGYAFTFELQGCMSTNATFSGTVFPGTYRVTVQGDYSNLPGDDFVVATAQAITANVASLVYDVMAFTIGGRVTLNGANPVSSQANCSAGSGGTYLPRGSVTFTDTARGYDFTFELQGCMSTDATFSGTVFPGNYRVTVRGNYSNLPGDSYVVAASQAISGNVASLSYDVKSRTIGGRVTLNGANPMSTQANCSAGSGGTYLPRGSVSFYDAVNGYSFTFELQGCMSTNATFTGTVFPGVYRVTVQGDYSNLPGDDFVVVPRLQVL